MSDFKERVEFIHKKAEMLASRYMSSQDYHDLVQEGVLAGLELLDKGVDDDKKIVGAMRRKMNDYTNYTNKTVPVPSSGTTRKALAAIHRGDTSKKVDWPLLQALTQSYGVSLDDCNLVLQEDHVKDYESTEYQQHIMFLLEETLDTRTYDMVMSVYFNGATQEDVAKAYGITQPRVNKVLEAGLLQIKQSLEEDNT